MYYLRGAHAEGEWLPESVAPAYRSRAHTESVDETPLADAFDAHSRDALKAIESALNSGSSDGMSEHVEHLGPQQRFASQVLQQ